MNKRQIAGSEFGQRGAVLITSLIFILAITLIGFAGMDIATSQEKMAGNLRNKQMAFEGAEAALREAEIFLETTVTLPPFNGTNGFYAKIANFSNHMGNIDWLDATQVVVFNKGFQELDEQPSYFIEEYELASNSDSYEAQQSVEFQYFRITARARGQSPSAVVVLQSIYRR
ncbi:MAG: hypothetical protein HRU06_14175 [Oceanospirillaceae bacterium]|nr:hypothetical protein [Oceanospirillaceae bacterium]